MTKELVTYIKLESYYAQFWRTFMGLKNGEPLVLPASISERYFLPFLEENGKRDNDGKIIERCYRKPGVNNKGYYKDASSYCQMAYEIATDQVQLPADGIGSKIPNANEINKLTPFVLPKILFRGGVEFRVNKFYELSQRGTARVREYIHNEFYQSLYEFIKDSRKPYNANAPFKTELVEQWLRMKNISDVEKIVNSVRVRLYDIYDVVDPGSVRRQFIKKMKEHSVPSSFV